MLLLALPGLAEAVPSTENVSFGFLQQGGDPASSILLTTLENGLLGWSPVESRTPPELATFGYWTGDVSEIGTQLDRGSNGSMLSYSLSQAGGEVATVIYPDAIARFTGRETGVYAGRLREAFGSQAQPADSDILPVFRP